MACLIFLTASAKVVSESSVMWTWAFSWRRLIICFSIVPAPIPKIRRGFRETFQGDEMEKCNAQYIFIASNYLGELKVMLKIGRSLGESTRMNILLAAT
jgi:hypothetical protein